MRITDTLEPNTARVAREAAAWQWRGQRPPFAHATGPGQLSVWEFPRPPRIERVEARFRIQAGGVTVVDTGVALRVCETASPPTYYFRRADFPPDVLVPAPGATSGCEWKGSATYLHLMAGGQRFAHAAWFYPNISAEYDWLADHVGVYASRVDGCFIDNERVVPQPGGFYAGWITADLTGPFKGEPGIPGA